MNDAYVTVNGGMPDGDGNSLRDKVIQYFQKTAKRLDGFTEDNSTRKTATIYQTGGITVIVDTQERYRGDSLTDTAVVHVGVRLSSDVTPVDTLTNKVKRLSRRFR